jgi:hypothetical protein
MTTHVVDILRQGLSVVLDFPANTVRQRSVVFIATDRADLAGVLGFTFKWSTVASACPVTRAG